MKNVFNWFKKKPKINRSENTFYVKNRLRRGFAKVEIPELDTIRDNIKDNSSSIDENRTNILKNKVDIEQNKVNIDVNKQNIETNRQNIETNKNNIEANANAINDLQMKDADIDNEIDALKQKDIQHETAINQNITNIAENTRLINLLEDADRNIIAEQTRIETKFDGEVANLKVKDVEQDNRLTILENKPSNDIIKIGATGNGLVMNKITFSNQMFFYTIQDSTVLLSLSNADFNKLQDTLNKGIRMGIRLKYFGIGFPNTIYWQRDLYSSLDNTNLQAPNKITLYLSHPTSNLSLVSNVDLKKGGNGNFTCSDVYFEFRSI